MSQYDFGVVLAGKIASGKSCIAKQLAALHGAPIVSFGNMIRSICAERGTEATRAACQDLGHELFTTLGADRLLELAVAYSKVPPSAKVVIVDGVRHVDVWEAVQRITESASLLFVDARFDDRYARSCALMTAPLSREEFKH